MNTIAWTSIAFLTLSSCMNRSSSAEPNKFSAVVVSFDPVVNDDYTKDQYRFLLSGCISSEKDGALQEDNRVSFDTPEKIKTGSMCVFQIVATTSKEQALEKIGVQWQQFPGLLYQDSAVQISVEPDGTRRGLSTDLKQQFEAPALVAEDKGGSITVKITVALEKFTVDNVEGRIDCIPLTPYQGSLKKLTTTTNNLPEYQLRVGVNKPSNDADSILYSCGLIRLFKDRKLLALGATAKTHSLKITKKEGDQQLPETVEMITSFRTETPVTVNPELKPKAH